MPIEVKQGLVQGQFQGLINPANNIAGLLGRVRPAAPYVAMCFIVVFSLATMSACTTLGGVPQLSGIGPQAASIGQREHPRVVAAYGGVYRNKQIEAFLEDITRKLVSQSPEPAQSYKLTILNSPVVNAFALPGGYLYVTRGLLALANDASEVAAVLSHEMAHVSEQHAFQRQQRAKQAKLVSKVVDDVIADDQQGQIALASSQLSLASFSRSQELAADTIGVQTMARAGLDPYAASRFLTSMSRYGQFRAASFSGNASSSNFLASHPATPERISQVINAARQMGVRNNAVRNQESYLQSINGLNFGDAPSEGYVRNRAYLHPKLGFIFELPKGYTLENTSEAVLAAHKNGTAMRFDGVQIPASQTLANYMASGWVNGLISSTIKSHTISGLEAATADASAKGWYFRIAVIRFRGATYRFLFANAEAEIDLVPAADATLSSFRKLNRQESKSLKPLSIKIVQVQAGDTVAGMAANMRGVSQRRELFLILNGLQRGAALRPGSLVKLVVD